MQDSCALDVNTGVNTLADLVKQWCMFGWSDVIVQNADMTNVGCSALLHLHRDDHGYLSHGLL